MKIHRLLEIVTLLLNRQSITAKELAERFEVSTRTIYRDIDVLSASGIPVYATKGVGGGISLLEDYALSKTLLTDPERESIVFALKTLQVTKYPEIDMVLEKLTSIFKNNAADWIHIDFSPWGSDPNQYDKMNNIKTAVLTCRMLAFDYLSAANVRSHRQIEPLRLIFKGQAWYLWGWCPEREDFRTFRISRMRAVVVLDITFERMRNRTPRTDGPAGIPEIKPLTPIELKFAESALQRLYDDYDDDFIIKNPDGTYTLKIDFPEDEWVYGYILSFGDQAEVVAPAHLREIIRERIRKMGEVY